MAITEAFSKGWCITGRVNLARMLIGQGLELIIAAAYSLVFVSRNDLILYVTISLFLNARPAESLIFEIYDVLVRSGWISRLPDVGCPSLCSVWFEYSVEVYPVQDC